MALLEQMPDCLSALQPERGSRYLCAFRRVQLPDGGFDPGDHGRVDTQFIHPQADQQRHRPEI
jgi:hypothetical protein